MPRKDENFLRYPRNWESIKAGILKRARNCCEKCGRPDRKTVSVADDGAWCGFGSDVWWDENGEETEPRSNGRRVKTILTVAHLDHVPEHCEPENLRAWCQRCHLVYDAAHHAETAGGLEAVEGVADSGERLGVEYWPIEKLFGYHRNVKKHSERQLNALCRLIREVGFRFPIAIDAEGVIIAGHARVVAAKRLGMAEVPCVVHRQLTEEQGRALRIADNRISELGKVDKSNMRAELDELLGKIDLTLVGYTGEEQANLLKAPAETEV